MIIAIKLSKKNCKKKYLYSDGMFLVFGDSVDVYLTKSSGFSTNQLKLQFWPISCIRPLEDLIKQIIRPPNLIAPTKKTQRKDHWSHLQQREIQNRICLWQCKMKISMNVGSKEQFNKQQITK